MLPATAQSACRVLGNASHGLHSNCPMIEMRCRLGGCCKGGGSKTQTGLHFLSLPQGRDKVLISMGPLSLPRGRDKNWSPVCCFHPPPVYNNRPHYRNLQNPEGVLMGFERACLESRRVCIRYRTVLANTHKLCKYTPSPCKHTPSPCKYTPNPCK